MLTANVDYNAIIHPLMRAPLPVDPLVTCPQVTALSSVVFLVVSLAS